MATVTPLNNWPVPTSTDLVKDGAVAIEALGDAIDASVGSGLLAWQTWAPTLSSGWSNGTGTWTAKYAQFGKVVIATGYFVVGNGTKNAGMNISLPITAATTNNINGFAYCGLTSTTGFSSLSVLPVNTTTIQLAALNSAATFISLASVAATGSAPIAWTTGSVLSFTVIYQAA